MGSVADQPDMKPKLSRVCGISLIDLDLHSSIFPFLFFLCFLKFELANIPSSTICPLLICFRCHPPSAPACFHASVGTPSGPRALFLFVAVITSLTLPSFIFSVLCRLDLSAVNSLCTFSSFRGQLKYSVLRWIFMFPLLLFTNLNFPLSNCHKMYKSNRLKQIKG